MGSDRAGECGVAKAPCKSCPYRPDVPSGVWAAEEYDKLPMYDGEIIEQLEKGGVGLFMCHQQDGNLCAGWLATHGSDNLLALRLNAHKVKDEVWGYSTKVPVFASGAEAATHGKAGIDEPSEKACKVVNRLSRKLGL